jgi:hypothetical protein
MKGRRHFQNSKVLISGGNGVPSVFRRPMRGSASADSVRGARGAPAGAPGEAAERPGADSMRILYIFPHPDDESSDRRGRWPLKSVKATTSFC